MHGEVEQQYTHSDLSYEDETECAERSGHNTFRSSVSCPGPGPCSSTASLAICRSCCSESFLPRRGRLIYELAMSAAEAQTQAAWERREQTLARSSGESGDREDGQEGKWRRQKDT